MSGWIVTRSQAGSAEVQDRAAAWRRWMAQESTWKREAWVWLPGRLPHWHLWADRIPRCADEPDWAWHGALKGTRGRIQVDGFKYLPRDFWAACVAAEAAYRAKQASLRTAA